MAGIYIHIPFCSKRCSYCDFYSVTDTVLIENYITALKSEIWIRREYLQKEFVSTIYFGGGTPSMLKIRNIEEILFTIYSVFSVENNAEITLECNPDDLTDNYLEELKNTKINRLSIGIQSFFDEDLKLMNRRHTSSQAIDAVYNAKKVGFTNISIDLIYGLPNMTLEKWNRNLEFAISLNIQHISAYHLTYHPSTTLGRHLKKEIIKEIDESESYNQYEIMKKRLESVGFIHYEISNFALPNYFSLHNSSYWKQIKYVGFGPSAHSYNCDSREWNYSDLSKYIKSINQGIIPSTIEILKLNEKYNDYVITSIRTIWGVDIRKIQQDYGLEYSNNFKNIITQYCKTDHAKWENNCLTLTNEGMFISDKIICDLIVID